MGVAVVMVEKRPSGAEKEPRRGDLSPDRGGRGRAAASIISEQKLQISTAEPERQKIYVYLLKFLFLVFLPFSKIIIS